MSELTVSALFKAYRVKLERFLARKSYAPEVYLRLLRLPTERIIERPEAYLYRIASDVVHGFSAKSRGR